MLFPVAALPDKPFKNPGGPPFLNGAAYSVDKDTKVPRELAQAQHALQLHSVQRRMPPWALPALAQAMPLGHAPLLHPLVNVEGNIFLDLCAGAALPAGDQQHGHHL